MPTITKRIIVNKNDEPTLIAEKLIDTDAEIVVFVVPKGARFSESLSNFKLIKREAEVLKKSVIIESTDKVALSLAEKSELPSENPNKGPLKTIADIRPISGARKTRKKKGSVTVPIVSEVEEVPVEVTQSEVVEEPEPLDEPPVEEAAFLRSTGEPVRPKRHIKIRPPTFKHGRLIFVIATVVVIALLYIGLAVLPSAQATIITKKEPWTFAKSLTIDTAISKLDTAALKVPGQLFTARKTLVEKYPANGRKYIERKSQGTLTIYNAYSSQPQSLVASTRFVTPGGAVYRIANSIIVPGARIVDGKIAPSSITVQALSDRPGPDYNTGPIARLSIPGFSGSPKYNGFYGEFKEGTTGGFIGEALVPTEADIKNARASGLKAVEAAVRTQLATQVPEGFSVNESPAKLTVVRQIVDGSTDSEGKFSVSTEADLSVMAFKERDVLTLLSEKAMTEKGVTYEVTSQDLQYGQVKTELVSKTTALLPVTYTADLAQKIDVEALKENIKGQSEEELRTTIFSLPGIESAHIALWPFWVRSVPNDEAKISVTVE